MEGQERPTFEPTNALPVDTVMVVAAWPVGTVMVVVACPVGVVMVVAAWQGHGTLESPGKLQGEGLPVSLGADQMEGSLGVESWAR